MLKQTEQALVPVIHSYAHHLYTLGPIPVRQGADKSAANAPPHIIRMDPYHLDYAYFGGAVTHTCHLAQEEIYQASMEELEQVREVHPRLVRYVGPHCVTRKGLVPEKEKEGPCPEGSRWCGVRVWQNFPRVKRAF